MDPQDLISHARMSSSTNPEDVPELVADVNRLFNRLSKEKQRFKMSAKKLREALEEAHKCKISDQKFREWLRAKHPKLYDRFFAINKPNG